MLYVLWPTRVCLRAPACVHASTSIRQPRPNSSATSDYNCPHAVGSDCAAMRRVYRGEVCATGRLAQLVRDAHDSIDRGSRRWHRNEQDATVVRFPRVLCSEVSTKSPTRTHRRGGSACSDDQCRWLAGTRPGVSIRAQRAWHTQPHALTRSRARTCNRIRSGEGARKRKSAGQCEVRAAERNGTM